MGGDRAASTSANPLFKKLRDRFLIVNLTTIVVIMSVAFASIYIITYRQVQGEIGMDLDRTAGTYRSGGNPPFHQGGGSGNAGNAGSSNAAGTNANGEGSTDSSSSGSGSGSAANPNGGSEAANESGSGETSGSAGSSGSASAGDARANGSFDGSDKPPTGAFGENGPPDRSVSFMMRTDASGALTETQSRFSSLTEDFYASALALAQKSDRNRGDFTLDGSRWTFMRMPSDNDTTMYVFIDTTSRQEILKTLIYTFAAVGVAMLIVLFFFSRFFANRSIRPVREAFDKQKQFIADASHELKTPLAVINTNADVLLANGDESIRSQEKWLRYIKSETERMAKLTGDLLYLTEMDDSRPGMVQARFDLSDAVENVMLTMEAVVFEKDLSLDYEIEPGLSLVGSREQIVQVTMILLDNAIKYANPRGRIDVSLKREHGEIRLAVSNTGEGIAAEHLPRVFDRFYRTDKSRTRSQGGHGLGLAIAKSIVEQHKGRISVKSTVGEQTTFSVHFPA
ncbi:two-component sensor histidine kinase [Saccharibacillus sp. O23]|uniref:sensor histidine kinase n=1 Tax=Saccharibacillus sp. O23 TaxID=2009338 RepID=UPI000B4E706E|nr:HAMP domain-containing sensor histidine kinase [Saccharibacillus sp. O23]OWR31935.1 two-component sensor histidine kinase [Saccharibacillus sp. O23]